MMNINGIKRILTKMLFSLYSSGYFSDKDIDKLFDIIHKSNMTKICKSIEEATKTVENYELDGTHRYEADFTQTSDKQFYYVFDKRTNKRLKSINYTPPKIVINDLQLNYLIQN